MCLIAFGWNAHPRWRLLLVGNRDEYHARPTTPLARWAAGSPLIGGRDLEAGGTWLGVTEDGRCCTVTNLRDPALPQSGLSRGLLPVDYLTGSADAAGFAGALHARAAAYRPFNLLLFDRARAFYLGNAPQPRLQAVADGVHGLSNADFNTPWPKTRQLMERLQAWLQRGSDDMAPLFEALADRCQADDRLLPDTGIGLALERRLSAAFIPGDVYGTRASSVVAIDHAGHGTVIERRFGPGGAALGETRLSW